VREQLLLRVAMMLVIVATIGCDRVTKHVATMTLAGSPMQSYLSDTVRLGYAENTGGFLSLGSSLPPAARTVIFIGGTGLALAVLLMVAVRAAVDRWTLLGLALFIGGGASNWIDRVMRGSVVDFLNVGLGPVRTGIFNVADVAIMTGAALVALAAFMLRKRPEEGGDGPEPVEEAR
jgi:signal peptidase II